MHPAVHSLREVPPSTGSPLGAHYVHTQHIPAEKQCFICKCYGKGLENHPRAKPSPPKKSSVHCPEVYDALHTVLMDCASVLLWAELPGITALPAGTQTVLAQDHLPWLSALRKEFGASWGGNREGIFGHAAGTLGCDAQPLVGTGHPKNGIAKLFPNKVGIMQTTAYPISKVVCIVH